MELLLGAGNSRDKRIRFSGVPDTWTELVTLDVDESLAVNVHHDLRNLPLPFGDDTFHEIHAYEVLEHCGQQGDWRLFFNQFNEFHRILKPGGYFCGTVPMWDSHWAWGDPGHTRVLTRYSFIYLSQKEYEFQVGKNSISDYRGVYQGDFETIGINESEHQLGFILRCLKGGVEPMCKVIAPSDPVTTTQLKSE